MPEPGDADRGVWMRYQTALVAPYLDTRTMSTALAQGWSLVAMHRVARSALTRSLAGAFGRLQALGDSWVDLVPGDGGALLRGSAVCASRIAFDDLVDPSSDDGSFDPIYETFPHPTSSALRAVAGIAHALSHRQIVRGGLLDGRPGVPARLVALHAVVERWVAIWWSARGDHSALASPDALVDQLWSPHWPFDPDDLHTAVRVIWARIGAHSPEVLDSVSDAADHAWVAWALSRAALD